MPVRVWHSAGDRTARSLSGKNEQNWLEIVNWTLELSNRQHFYNSNVDTRRKYPKYLVVLLKHPDNTIWAKQVLKFSLFYIFPTRLSWQGTCGPCGWSGSPAGSHSPLSPSFFSSPAGSSSSSCQSHICPEHHLNRTQFNTGVETQSNISPSVTIEHSNSLILV